MFGETVAEPLRPFSFNGRVSDRFPRGFALERGLEAPSAFGYLGSDPALGKPGSYSAMPGVASVSGVNGLNGVSAVPNVPNVPSVSRRSPFRGSGHLQDQQSLSPTPMSSSLSNGLSNGLSSGLGSGRGSEEAGILVTFFALAASVQHAAFLRALGELATLYDSLVSARKNLMIVAYWTTRSEGELMNSVCEKLGNGSNLVTVVGSFSASTLLNIHEYVQ